MPTHTNALPPSPADPCDQPGDPTGARQQPRSLPAAARQCSASLGGRIGGEEGEDVASGK